MGQGWRMMGEDEDQGVIVEKETEWMITSLSVVAESRLTVSSAQLVVKHNLEDTIGEGKVECADFEEWLVVGTEAMREHFHFDSVRMLLRRDLRDLSDGVDMDPSDGTETEARLGLADRKDSPEDRPTGFGDGGVKISMALLRPQGPCLNLR